jgi:hypothetical protein
MPHLSHHGIQLQMRAWRSLDTTYAAVHHGPTMPGYSHHHDLEVIEMASGPDARAAIQQAERARRDGWHEPAGWMGSGDGHMGDALPPGTGWPQSPWAFPGLSFPNHPHSPKRRRRIDPIEFCIHFSLANTAVAPLSFSSIVLELDRGVGPPLLISKTFGAKEDPEIQRLKSQAVHEGIFSTNGHTSNLIFDPEYDTLKLRFMVIHRDRIVLGPVTTTVPALAQLPRIDRDIFASALDHTCPKGSFTLPLFNPSHN